MSLIYNNIHASALIGKKRLAVLIDPDKMELKNVAGFISKLNQSIAKYIFVGGSKVNGNATENLVEEIKKHTNLPIILFPGDINQITDKADGLLFLSLISGRNAEYLIGKHIASISKLEETKLEIISTGYVLIEGGRDSAIEEETQTKPLKQENVQEIVNTSKAGELLGMKLIYLEAGSGAVNPVSKEIIKRVKQEIAIPLIVGGGIRTREQLNNAFNSGADIVVIGTAFEEDELFFEALKVPLSLGHFLKGEKSG